MAQQLFSIRVKQAVYYEILVQGATYEKARDHVAELLAEGDGELLDMYEVDSTDFEIVDRAKEQL